MIAYVVSIVFDERTGQGVTTALATRASSIDKPEHILEALIKQHGISEKKIRNITTVAVKADSDITFCMIDLKANESTNPSPAV